MTRVALCFVPGLGWVVFGITVAASMLGEYGGERIGKKITSLIYTRE